MVTLVQTQMCDIHDWPLIEVSDMCPECDDKNKDCKLCSGTGSVAYDVCERCEE